MPYQRTNVRVQLVFTGDTVVISGCSPNLKHLDGLTVSGSLTLTKATGLNSIQITANLAEPKKRVGDGYKPSKAETRAMIETLCKGKEVKKKVKPVITQEVRDILRKFGY